MLFMEYYTKSLKDLIENKRNKSQEFNLIEISHFGLQIAKV